MIISTKHLSRDLVILGIASIILGAIMGLSKSNYFSSIPYLSAALILFCLAFGVAKKQKWAWTMGLLIFISSILISFIILLLNPSELIYFTVSLIIPTLLIATFIKSKKETTLESKISVFPFLLLIILSIINIGSQLYEPTYLKNKKNERNLPFCQSKCDLYWENGYEGSLYLKYFDGDFESVDECTDYCMQKAKEEIK